jgi:hypothetical protein
MGGYMDLPANLAFFMGIISVLIAVIALDRFACKALHVALGANGSFFAIWASHLRAIHFDTRKLYPPMLKWLKAISAEWRSFANFAVIHITLPSISETEKF